MDTYKKEGNKMARMQKGDKIEVKVTITEVTERFIQTRTGGTLNTPERTFKMQDSEGNILTWFAKEAINIGSKGDQITIRATVKEVTDTEVKLIRCRKVK